MSDSLVGFERTQHKKSIPESEPSGSLSVVRMLIAYNGSGFRGLAPNPGVRTVVGEVSAVLKILYGFSPSIVMSGRTDAGVHAWGQVLSVELPVDRVPLRRLERTFSKRLSPEIVLREVSVVDSTFSARFSASSRQYRYSVLNRSVADPFLAATSWWVPDSLNLEEMNKASRLFLGEHDFSSFCRKPKPIPGQVVHSLKRRILSAEWFEIEDGFLRFEISGSAFCHQMVRSLVGFLIAVGKGKRSSGEVLDVLSAKDRAAAETIAPPHGLMLWHVGY